MYDYILNDINYPVLKPVVKYKDHPRIKAIENFISQTAYLSSPMWKKKKYLMKL